MNRKRWTIKEKQTAAMADVIVRFSHGKIEVS